MKDRKTYKILTWCSFFFPINRFYIGNTKGIILRSISCNLLMFGWIGDLMYMDKIVCWVGDFYQHYATSVFNSNFCCLVRQ